MCPLYVYDSLRYTQFYMKNMAVLFATSFDGLCWKDIWSSLCIILPTNLGNHYSEPLLLLLQLTTLSQQLVRSTCTLDESGLYSCAFSLHNCHYLFKPEYTRYKFYFIATAYEPSASYTVQTDSTGSYISVNSVKVALSQNNAPLVTGNLVIVFKPQSPDIISVDAYLSWENESVHLFSAPD